MYRPPPSTHRQVAAALLADNEGRYILQQRDNVPGIVHPGKVSLFGGQREGHETFLQCVVREVHEELTYFIPPERFTFLTRYRVDDPRSDTGALYAELFFARDVPLSEIKVTEGSLLLVEADHFDDVPNLTEPARLAITTMLKLFATKR